MKLTSVALSSLLLFSVPFWGQQSIESNPTPKFRSFNHLTPKAKQAVKKEAQASANVAGTFSPSTPATIHSIPHWSSAYVDQTDGNVYPYTMVGSKPSKGGTTQAETVTIPLTFVFAGSDDGTGNPVTYKPDTILDLAQNSPTFRTSAYDSGVVQYGDGLQRDEFPEGIKKKWHTKVDPDGFLRPLTIVVPFGSYHAFHYRSTGALAFYAVDINFFYTALRNAIATTVKPTQFPIVLSKGVYMYDSNGCCIIGYHDAYDTFVGAHSVTIQTYTWVSWIDPGPFGTGVEDVYALAHEVNEWLNDPFGNNLVQPWEFPGIPGSCQGNLEVGDPIEVLPGRTDNPVTIDGFTYHPTNNAVFQWFARTLPSDALNGSYSWPNPALLTSPAGNCR